MRIVLLGAPGSGKGTQAKKLMAEKNIPQISSGDMLREAAAAGTVIGRKAKAIIDSGQLVSDDIVLEIVRDRLEMPDAADGFILDGFPRTEQQALNLEELLAQIGKPLDAAILLDVDSEVLMKRLTGRRTCSRTGRLLNIHFSSQEELEACISAGGELIQREDDNEETIASRLDVYHSQTEPLIDFYQRRENLIVVDATGSADEVYGRFLEALQEF
jgi:adenylate kinase